MYNKDINTVFAAKTFSKECKNGLRGLSRRFGFDYNKPLLEYLRRGRFTNRQILDEFEKRGYSVRGDKPAVVVAAVKNSWGKKFDVARILGAGAGDFDVDYRFHGITHGAKSADCALDWYYRKSDYTEARKDEDCYTFFIAQNWDDLRAAPTHTCSINAKVLNDMGARYRVIESRHGYDIFTKDGGGGETASAQNYAFDKSGYLVGVKRTELEQKAAELRAERKKAAYLSTDNESAIRVLSATIEDTKAAIVRALTYATTEAEFDKVDEALSRWRGFRSAVSDFATLRKRELARDFDSVDAFDRACKNINGALVYAMNALQ